jgi:thiol-disulfide isomerase/thioredoxin
MKLITFVSALLLCALQSQSQPGEARIGGAIYSLHEGDTMILTTFDYGQSMNPDSQKRYEALVHQHQFSFTVPVSHPSYFRLTPRTFGSLGIGGYLLEEGDDVHIDFGDQEVTIVPTIDHTTYNTSKRKPIQYSGKGAQRFAIMQLLERMQSPFYAQLDDPAQTARFLKVSDSLAQAKLAFLASHQHIFSTRAYALLQAELYSQIAGRCYASMKQLPALRRAMDMYDNPKLVSRAISQLAQNPMAAYAVNYPDNLENYIALGLLKHYPADSLLLWRITRELSTRFKGLQRDVLLGDFVFAQREHPEANVSALIDTALVYVQATDVRTFLHQFKRARMAGNDAYNFTLPDTAGTLHTLQEFRGKVVILDFFFTGCGACRQLAPYLTVLEKQYTGKDVAFVSISIDLNKDFWVKSVNNRNYTNPEIVNLYTGGQTSNHPAIKQNYVTGYPTLLVVDKAGKLCRNPVLPLDDQGSDLTRVIDEALAR